jgi:WhiB family transcriptional regulator, redox-sensing transcriptional regulator
MADQAPAWMRQARCRDVDPEVFFPLAGSRGRASRRAAKAICAFCLVKGQCAAYGAVAGRGYGVWGGVDLARPGRRGRPPANGRVLEPAPQQPFRSGPGGGAV